MDGHHPLSERRSCDYGVTMPQLPRSSSMLSPLLQWSSTEPLLSSTHLSLGPLPRQPWSTDHEPRLDLPREDMSHLVSEDIWNDSPNFRRYVKQREAWLSEFLLWFQSVQQIWQLQKAYAKLTRQLMQQTNVLLINDVSEHAASLSHDTVPPSVAERVMEDILRPLYKQATSIRRILGKSRHGLITARKQFEQASARYCTLQKTRGRTSKRVMDDLAANLYICKRTMCEITFEYMSDMASIIQKTRTLLTEHTSTILQTLQSEKRSTMNHLENMVRSLPENIEPVADAQKSPFDLAYSRPISPANSMCSYKPSFADDYEIDDRLSFYLQEKLAVYHDDLKINVASQEKTSLSRPRPSSPTSFISFLNKPRTMHRYSSLDSLLVDPSAAFMASKIVTEGYLFMKQKYDGQTTWQRSYFEIEKDSGMLMQRQEDGTGSAVIQLRTMAFKVPQQEKRDFVMQLVPSFQDSGKGAILQAETATDFAHWYKAFVSWRSLKCKSQQTMPKGRRSAIPPPRNAHTRSSDSLLSFSRYSTIHSDSEALFSDSGKVGRSSRSTFRCPAGCDTEAYRDKVIKTATFRMRESAGRKEDAKSDYWPLVQVTVLANGILHFHCEDVWDQQACSTWHHESIYLCTLSRQQIYSVAKSVFQSSCCFALRSSPLDTYYVWTNTCQERDEWMTLLKIFCVPSFLLKPTPDTIDSHSYRQGRTLTVQVVEARHVPINNKDPPSNELYCDVIIDNEKIASTGCLQRTATPFWREEFVFRDLQKIRRGVTVHLNSKHANKTDRGTCLGSVFVPLAELHRGQDMVEEWHELRKEGRHRTFSTFASLSGVYNQMPLNGIEIKLAFRLEEQIVLPYDHYKHLVELLSRFDNEAIYEIARQTRNLDNFAQILLRIYEALGQSVRWIKSLIDFEVSAMHADNANILFRGNSLLTKVLDTYMKLVGKEYLDQAVGGIVQTICKSKVHIEVIPSRLPHSGSNDCLISQCEKLSHYVQLAWKSIEASQTKCPP
ncbi:uncharacterized protein BYT42DRAFT_188089 [Radiomyces spectabilis]|uniref:uncharacterized protein n=1 Tax=Radiomyces spectabilis TaxID=64574 RepID=UPI0022210A4B|nr:uncharacterized protein BYT42DRAFT_188089 [Radiomyces spectabilis]KAI8391267.1 hypothetical protein BYT42DRAFT_188089 [Radiomyces spectabilis]